MRMSDKLDRDQARTLRRGRPRPVQVVAVASGKGGVGKTSVSVNLGAALAQRGRSVMLLDADLGLANIDVLLGLNPAVNLSHVLDGTHTLDEIVVDGPEGLAIVPASSGIARMADLSVREQVGIIQAFSEFGRELDYLIVDVAAGISSDVSMFCSAAQQVVVVVCDEPASLTDAYALIKVLSRQHLVPRFKILSNMVDHAAHGHELYQKLRLVCDRFLDVKLDHLGSIPQDGYVRAAIQRQRPVVSAFPGAPAARAFKKLAQVADNLPVPAGNSGRIEFFVERLVGAGVTPALAARPGG